MNLLSFNSLIKSGSLVSLPVMNEETLREQDTVNIEAATLMGKLRLFYPMWMNKSISVIIEYKKNVILSSRRPGVSTASFSHL